jgi:uncharacterized membrane protein
MKRLLALCTLLVLSGSALAGGNFETLPFGGSFFGGGVQMSADGQVVAGYWNVPLYWTEADGMVLLPVGASLPATVDISGDGSTVVSEIIKPEDGLHHAATFAIADGVWTYLGDLGDTEGCDANFSSGWGCNYDASIVAGMRWITGCDAEATRWDGGVPTALGRFAPSSSRASVIADNGSVIGGWAEHPDYGMRRPAIWGPGDTTPQLIGDPENDAGEVYDLSPDGSAAVGAKNSFAFHYDIASASFTEIGSLYEDPFGSNAFAISGEGTVVGQSGSQWWSTPYAFIWTADMGITYLGDYLTAMSVAGYNGEWLYNAMDISDDGKTIVGTYLNETDYMIYPFIVRIEDTTPAVLSSFTFTVSPGAVDFRFEVFGDATAADLELRAGKDGAQWQVAVDGANGDFGARDESALLASGGQVRYSLYYRENGESQLLRSEDVDLGSSALADRLLGAFPNPFNPKTAISFTLGKAQRVQLAVFDLSGRRIALLADAQFDAGRHSVEWNGRDERGQAASSGTYFVRLAGAGRSEMQKVTLLK